MTGRYETMGEDLATLICLECSTRTTGVTIPADERDQHDGWHDARDANSLALCTVLQLAELNVGQAVRFTADGRSHDVTVTREFRGADGNGFGSLEYSVVTVGYGPGRWNTEVNAAGIAAGRYTLEIIGA
jgi:hypothetical protein